MTTSIRSGPWQALPPSVADVIEPELDAITEEIMATIAREVAASFKPAELRAWFDELIKLSVQQAVQKIRVLIAGNTEAVS